MSAWVAKASDLWQQWRLPAEGAPAPLYDRGLVCLALTLMCIGFVIITSASMPVAERLHGNAFHFAVRHAIYLGLALVIALVALQVPMQAWQKSSGILLLFGMLLLLAVLVVGRNVNGSTRWLVVGPITVQAAEPAKLFFFCYLSGYLVRRHQEVRDNIKGFIKPLVVLFILALLLLFQPDLGTVVVMAAATVGLLFLAGAKLWQFFALVLTLASAFTILIVVEPYRLRRLLAFWDPWEDPFGKGYQLTQSLMAYGRGSGTGVGLGNSIQKLEYLPEAHTDFIFAVLAEELGFVGVCLVLSVLFVLVYKALKLGKKAIDMERSFEGFFAYAIGIWFSFQTAVNVGASAGILPTKGLTLPLVSYGGSSLIVMTLAVVVLLRIDHELKMQSLQATSGGKS